MIQSQSRGFDDKQSAPQKPPERSPEFLPGVDGVGGPHAAFLMEGPCTWLIPGCKWVQGNEFAVNADLSASFVDQLIVLRQSR